MSRIYKYPIALQDIQMIEIPRYATLLDCQVQNGQLVIWAIVDPEQETELRTLFIYGTGHEIDLLDEQYLGTVQMGSFVWHVFAALNSEEGAHE